MRALVPFVALVAVFAPEVLPAQASEAVQATEWKVPYGGRPRDPYVAPDGRVFFVGQAGNYIGRLDPGNGDFTRFEIDPGTNPAQPDHRPAGDGLVRREPERDDRQARSAHGHDHALPDARLPGARSAHADLRPDRQHLVHRAELQRRGPSRCADGADPPRQDRRADAPVRDRDQLQERAVVQPVRHEQDRDHRSGHDGGQDFDLPHERARGRRIAITSDDVVWYVDYTRGFLGRVDPASGRVEEYPMPGGPSSLPYGMASDDKDRLWMAESGPKGARLVGYDPKTRKFFGITPVGEEANNTIRHMYFDPKTGLLWFGTDQGMIGRAQVSGPRVAM
jgi:virginiamycin B lyase